MTFTEVRGDESLAGDLEGEQTQAGRPHRTLNHLEHVAGRDATDLSHSSKGRHREKWSFFPRCMLCPFGTRTEPFCQGADSLRS